ncbi:hypothetical protein N8746_01995 [Alphaproteobacteria bacterium]|nr:hypothetical protein [Alphaproteobacteria bacterium]
MSIDDEKRWLVSLISDTGMRLAEGVGLLTSDIKLEEEVPYIKLRRHPWRTLPLLILLPEHDPFDKVGRIVLFLDATS